MKEDEMSATCSMHGCLWIFGWLWWLTTSTSLWITYTKS